MELLGNIDYMIVILYMIITLIIGISSGSKITNFREFAVKKQNYGSFALLATIFASIVGANSTVGNVAQIFSVGLIFMLVPLGQSMKSLVISEFIAPVMIKRFKEAMSIGDIFQQIYGKTGRIISGLSCALFGLIATSAQVFAIGFLFEFFFGFDLYTSTIVGYGIIILYSSFGGINSVIRTDIFQFFILIIVLPMVASQGLKQVGGYEELFTRIPSNYISFDQPELLLKYGMMMIVFCFFHISPVVIQRVMLGANIEAVKRSFRMTTLMSIIFLFIISIIGLSVILIDNTVQPNQALFFMVENLMPEGLKGIVISGLIAVIMSSADSGLNVAGVSIYNDIISPLNNKKISGKTEVIIIRIVTLITGLFSVIAALEFDHILSIMLFSISFWAPVVLVPFYAIIINRAVSVRGLVACVITGLSGSFIFAYGILQDPTATHGLVPAMGMVTIVFIISYFKEGRKIWNN